VRLVRLLVTGPEPATQPGAETLLDILWAHLGPGHDIEHITATATPQGIDLAVFLRNSISDPDEYARGIVEGIMGRLPALCRWKCDPVN
jgi:hypothetical protein